MHIFILSSCPPPCTFQTFIPCCIIIFILDSFRTFFQRLFFKTKSSYTKTIFANTLINIFVISTINVSKLRSAQTRIDEAEGGKKRIKKTVSTASNYLSFLYLKSVRIRTTTLFLVSLSRDTTRSVEEASQEEYQSRDPPPPPLESSRFEDGRKRFRNGTFHAPSSSVLEKRDAVTV